MFDTDVKKFCLNKLRRNSLCTVVVLKENEKLFYCCSIKVLENLQCKWKKN